ncbi:hypothetical protein HK097_000156, partial [Rhizophlyctis rosea]
NAHSPAFGLIAAGELLCTIAILNVVIGQIRAERDMATRLATHKHLFGSSFFVLLIVDLVGVILAVTANFPYHLQELLTPFLALKSAFALVLAIDALVIRLILSHTSMGGPTSFISNDHAYRSGLQPRTPYNTYQTASAYASGGGISITSVDRRLSGWKGREGSKGGSFVGGYGVISPGVSGNRSMNGGEDGYGPTTGSSPRGSAIVESPRSLVAGGEMVEVGKGGFASRTGSVISVKEGGGWASRTTSVSGSVGGMASRTASVNSVIGRSGPESARSGVDSRSSSPVVSPALTPLPSAVTLENGLQRTPLAPLGEERREESS